MIVPVLLAVVFVVLLADGCDKNGRNGSSELVGTWQNEMMGQKGEDIVKTVIVLKDDGTMTTTFNSDIDETPYKLDMFWKAEGKTFKYALNDSDKDGKPDSQDKLEWSEVQYELAAGKPEYREGSVFLAIRRR